VRTLVRRWDCCLWSKVRRRGLGQLLALPSPLTPRGLLVRREPTLAHATDCREHVEPQRVSGDVSERARITNIPAHPVKIKEAGSRAEHLPALPAQAEDSLHSHTNSHSVDASGVLRWSLVATLIFAAVEVAAGMRAHSLALLSDAGHNFTDALALLLAWFGVFFQSKPADEIKTYGYHRAGVLAAFVNAATLLAVFIVPVLYVVIQRVGERKKS